MVTDLRCWRLNHSVGDFFRYVGDFFNVFNRSPTSQTCHQHILSPAFVINIDVTSDFRWPDRYQEFKTVKKEHRRILDTMEHVKEPICYFYSVFGEMFIQPELSI